MVQTDFNQAIELNPQDQWAIASRGETYRLMGHYDNALTDFNHVIALWPDTDTIAAEEDHSHHSANSEASTDH